MIQHRATSYQIDIISDLQKWRSFVAIAELGSLMRAAAFLNSNQSFLSRLIITKSAQPRFNLSLR